MTSKRLRGRKLAVLKEGFVRLVDYMGDDSAIVQAARVSYGEGTKTIHKDEGLIRYLMRHQHTTPFEMCEIKLHVRVPMDTWRQWIRHRTANVNEYSTRYSKAIDVQHVPDADKFRRQTQKNRQGSIDLLSPEDGEFLRQETIELYGHAERVYKTRLQFEVAREQAREVLPLSNYTEAYWKIDLHNLLHFLALRMDKHAQEEIRAFANAISTFVQDWVPLTWAAFEDYRLKAMKLTARDILVIQSAMPRCRFEIDRYLLDWGWAVESGGELKLVRSRERDECEEKLYALNIERPWRFWPSIS